MPDPTPNDDVLNLAWLREHAEPISHEQVSSTVSGDAVKAFFENCWECADCGALVNGRYDYCLRCAGEA